MRFAKKETERGQSRKAKEEEKKEANGGGDRWETRMDRKRIKRDDSKEEKWDEATKQDQKRPEVVLV